MSNINIKDDASLWWESRNTQSQDFEIPEPQPTFVNLDNSDEIEEQQDLTNKEVRNQLNMIKLNEPTAEIITNLMNSIIPVIFVLIIKSAEKENLELTQSERETLTNAWAQYLRDSNIQMSPGVVLLGTIAIIYGSKITMVLTERKREKDLEEKEQKQAQQIEKLTSRLEELEKNDNEKKN